MTLQEQATEYKELSELAKKKADDSKFSLRIDSKTDINSQT